MYTLLPKVSSLGYFSPFATDEQDPRLRLIKDVFRLKDNAESMYGVTVQVQRVGMA